ncbi:class I SAM-dependent methyltransferase [Haladaptatus halobius]|uniref:class I SAM-dependent methyltransferase n=1 Tax=Haladaptatus halobius TaxID=2884875 RepID=UPI001D0BC1F8|nr:class I SAM-dependent methyltransferase [Haladaptatus halobius]
MSDPPTHKRTVREEFTKQANAYATNSSVTDPEKIDRLVQATTASPDTRMLEVATGPGHVAFRFADVCDEVVGIDLTKAPLEIAREKKQKRETKNIEFMQGDAEEIPFPDDSFDIVVCRLALHHVENPGRVFQEITRVCRSGGTIAIDDLVVSEHPERGAYQNKFERLRDPSHVRALAVSEILGLFTKSDVEVDQIETGVLVPEVEEWLCNAQTPEIRAMKVRDLIKRDAEQDLSGTRPFWNDGELHFVQRTAIVAGYKLGSSTTDVE